MAAPTTLRVLNASATRVPGFQQRRQITPHAVGAGLGVRSLGERRSLGLQVLAHLPRRAVTAAAATGPWQLPENTGSAMFEGAMTCVMGAMFVSLVWMSLQALSVVAVSNSMAATTGMAARSMGSVAVNGPIGMFLHAVASTLGVFISAGTNSVPGALFGAFRTMFIAVAGSLLHIVAT